MNKIYKYLKQLAKTPIEKRKLFLESIKIKSYSSPEISETDIWILTKASNDNIYLEKKLKEAEDLALDIEAPEEREEDKLSSNSSTSEIPLDSEGELVLDPETSEEEIDNSFDDDDSSKEENEIETSKEGIGILPLIAEIQEKLASGKPSEVELAALKALKKLVS